MNMQLNKLTLDRTDTKQHLKYADTTDNRKREIRLITYHKLI